MHHQEFLVRAHLDAVVLEQWVAAGWLIPVEREGQREFSDVDLARAHLINDLRGDIGVNDEGIAVILHLLDQLHGLRQTLGDFLSAVRAEPDDFRERLAIHLHRSLNRQDETDPQR